MASGPPTGKPTPAQVAALGGSYLTKPIYLGTVAHYLINETSGTTLADVSGNALTASSPNTDAADWTDTGLRFDAAPEQADTSADAALLIPGDISVSMWVRINTWAVFGSLIDISSGTGETENQNILFQIFLAGSSGAIDLVCLHERGAGINDQVIFNTNLVQGTAYHVVAVRDVTANTYTMYIDGVALTPLAYTADPTAGAATTKALAISGLVGSSSSHTATFYDMHVYNRILSAAEALELFTDPYGAFAASGGGGVNTVLLRRRRSALESASR